MAKQKKQPRFPTRNDIANYLSSADGSASRRDIARAFGVKGDDRARLRSLLKEMEEDGSLKRTGPKKVARADSLPPVLAIDVMSVDDDGDMECLPSSWEGETEPPAIRLSAREAAKQKPAIGVGDRLLVRLSAAGDDGYDARIIRQLGRSAHRFLAVFRKTKFGGIAEPVERRAKNKFSIDGANAREAKDGDLVWIEASPQRGRGLGRARVREIAGHVDDKNAFSLIALAAHEAPVEMPADVIAEAEAAKPPTLGKRTDLREIPLVTIDPVDAKDHDDAVWAAKDDDPANEGGFKIIVAIADVSWFVRPGSKLDREAFKRGNSIYLPDRVVPMLPERLSNDLCSLKEGVDRPAIAVEMTIDHNGHKRRHRFMRVMMRSAAKLSYEDAQRIIGDEKQEGEIAETVSTLYAAFSTRWKERKKRAPLDLDLPERKIILNEDGTVARIIKRERFDAHRVIEEFMILANVAAAETLERAKLTQIYRVHETPDVEKLKSVREYLGDLDYSLSEGAPKPAQFNQILKIAAERGQQEMISDIVLRAQSQAVYSTENVGHFGLNLPRYSHFTSPIRRYADLTIHRALVTAAKLGEGGQTAEESQRLSRIAEQISDAERRAVAIEREAVDRYVAGYLEDRVGEEFSGRIRGVTRFGVFVMLDETGADGFVPARTLGSERFEFFEERHALVGVHTGGVYHLGQPVRVQLTEAAPLRGGLIFDMISDPVEDPGFTPRPSRRKSERRSGKKPKKRDGRNKAPRGKQRTKSTKRGKRK
ncbi:MAG: ribonuclease R [Parvularculaceae bacterium]